VWISSLPSKLCSSSVNLAHLARNLFTVPIFALTIYHSLSLFLQTYNSVGFTYPFLYMSICITAFITRLPDTWRLLHSNLWCARSTISSFWQASLPRCASTQSQLVWASSICCCRPDCLELTERWSAWSDA